MPITTHNSTFVVVLATMVHEMQKLILKQPLVCWVGKQANSLRSDAGKYESAWRHMRHNDVETERILQPPHNDHSKNCLFWKAGKLAIVPEVAPPPGAVEEELMHQPHTTTMLMAMWKAWPLIRWELHSPQSSSTDAF